MSQDDVVGQTLDRAKPILSKLTFGSIIGYCSGVAAQKVGRAVAVLAGLSFIAIQSAVYSGYVDVDWKKIQDDAVKSVDTDGDGELTVKDIKSYWEKVKKILTHNIPNASGFSVGFLYGVSAR
uniref:EF-hand domain-containing protein n=1 Tax=Eucampia antarctica TaxID=49252 RepID=A0A7S2R2Q5_9STRA|mmetsp:Transcript_14613/g.14086  ORF Transcript_14613/g.14086 Transcript_14613/m.14086 type:complete len:123 (+) Transcript_14613:134-502(+)|eukprot:CAMPEP_0197828416 /NCGR_PEP_ID=MMETSP1437-20131217/4978_1 /TAXON_ID=49252 ORGANISM="Eucampia antarctica, Strain CCMP1452" /NCGR_SAMPLE_ID=MMETSP1437 /ASSEMBLY_ACC=CAM_ASM_001096 /LENGTH=122 /DNA_ID=CAMNT_0043429607 /DNA_START=126 /DNA_END=494 /DNA_ORIENTATION=+